MLHDVLDVVATAKKGKASAEEKGYIRHYGVFIEVIDPKLYKGNDTWQQTQRHFGEVSAQAMANALLELSKTDKSTSVKVGQRILVSLSEADFADLQGLIKR